MKKLPLTDLQKGILFEIKRSNERNYYINQEIIYFKANIDIALMQKAFLLLIAKYEILRSTVIFVSNQPTFIIYENVELPFAIYDYSNLDNNKKEKIFNDFIEEDFAKTIDVNKAPLLRVSVLKFAAFARKLLSSKVVLNHNLTKLNLVNSCTK